LCAFRFGDVLTAADAVLEHRPKNQKASVPSDRSGDLGY
jgi:hypothetical protein